jgi:hypothetical protein
VGRAGGGDGGCGEGQKPVISTFRGNESVHTSISLISEINEWAINHVSFWDEFVLLAYEYEPSGSLANNYASNSIIYLKEVWTNLHSLTTPKWKNIRTIAFINLILLK